MYTRKAFFWTVLFSLIVISCDSQTEVPTAEFNVNIGQYTDEVWDDFNAEVPRIGQVNLPENMAVDLERFPHKRIKISSSGYGSGREYDERLSLELTRSIYLFFIPEGSLPRISDVVATIPQPLDKRASTDSLNLDVYAFILERPGVAYPESIPIGFTVDDVPYTLEVITAEHLILLKDQVIVNGSSFSPLPEKEGIVIEMDSETYDESLLPVVLLHRTEVHYSEDQIELGSVDMVGMAYDSSMTQTHFSYGRQGNHQQRILKDTEVRAFILKR